MGKERGRGSTERGSIFTFPFPAKSKDSTNELIALTYSCILKLNTLEDIFVTTVSMNLHSSLITLNTHLYCRYSTIWGHVEKYSLLFTYYIAFVWSALVREGRKAGGRTKEVSRSFPLISCLSLL